MKILISIISALLLITSCQPKISNDIETLEKVFNMNKFDIEILSTGCFGGSSELFTVTKQKEGYLLKSERTKKSHTISDLKMDSLHVYLTDKIGKDDFGGCTLREYIRVGTMFNSVDYEHNYCLGPKATMINDLLAYYELVTKDEN